MADDQEFLAEQVAVQRSNLLGICRMCISSLVDKSVFEMISDDCAHLRNFCVALEHVLKHRMSSVNRGFLFGSESPADPWEPVKLFAVPSTVVCVEDMESITTNIGKLRLWIKLSLVQKKLARSIANIEKKHSILGRYYLPDSFICSENVSILAESLKCLDAIDFNLCLREQKEDMERWIYEIDYSHYLTFKQSSSSKADDELERRRLEQLSVSIDNSPVTTNGSPQDNVLQLKDMLKTEREQRNYFEELVKVRDSQLQRLEERYRTDMKGFDSQSKQLEAIVLELQQQLQEKQDEIVLLKKKAGK